MEHYPTAWQKKVIWAALTGIAIVVLGAVAVFLLMVFIRVLGFLQPLLIPIAVAGVLAYLLTPVVNRLERFGWSRMRAVLLVFGVFLLTAVLIFGWIGPVIYHEGAEFVRDVPRLVQKGREMFTRVLEQYQQQAAMSPYLQDATASLQQKLPEMLGHAWGFITRSVGGFLGFFGFLFGLILIPLYLFFMLKESNRIAARWSDYLPLKASGFKDEVVSAINEINGYLIAFFRGQLIVSVVDGIFIGLGLWLMGLNFAVLIGLLVAILGLIPYLGMLICWLPAVIIAAVQFGDWTHALIVTAIFIGVNQLEGWLLAPKIVGDAVELHPLTVIVSVIGWSLLLGGLLGAILAVPLTATFKVLLRRYVWERRWRPRMVEPGTGATMVATES